MQLVDLSWPEVAARAAHTPIILPIAAIEQHGHHLPVSTDSMLLAELIRRISKPLHGQAIFAPLMWLGNSDHHIDFPGTLSARPRHYLDMLGGLIDDMITHGFRRIVLLNGHGGNDIPGRQAIFEARQRYRHRSDLLLLFVTYWDCARPWETCGDLVQHFMGHACEWETSMMQCIVPDLVKEVRELETVSVEYGFAPSYRGWTSKDRTIPGHMGSPQYATPEKGERLFSAFAEGVEKMIHQTIAWDGHSWNPDNVQKS